MELKPIDEQVVVIVGASSGIGRETALRFADQGARVVVSARSQSGLDSLVDEIRRRGGQAMAVAADAADFEAMKMVADQAAGYFGRIDTWVHLAAVALYASFEETTPEEFRQLIEVNLLGQVHGAMAALPHLRREGSGALIHISSAEGVRALPYQSAYAASKHAIVGFTDALRLELQHESVPISVTTILPASINTPFFDKARTRLGVKPKGMPPIYQPDIVAEAILYAAANPTRHLFIGGSAKLFALSQAMSPGLTDAFLRYTAFSAQRTDEPKSADAPNNLFEPIEGYNQVHGDFDDQALPTSLYTKAVMNPVVKEVAGAAALLALAGLARRALHNGSSREATAWEQLPI